MPNKRHNSSAQAPPSKRIALEPIPEPIPETYGNFFSMEMTQVLPQLIGLLDRVSLQRFTSTCNKLRKHAPKNYNLATLKPEQEVEPLDLLEISILDVANMSIESLRETFGNYSKVKYLRITGHGILGDNKEDQEILEYGLLNARDFFTEVISLELFRYHICFDLTIDNENFEKLKIFRISQCIYDQKHEIVISLPLQDVGIYPITEDPVLIAIPRGIKFGDFHGNCQIEIDRGFDRYGLIEITTSEINPRKW